MKRLLLLFGLILASFVFVNAQAASQTDKERAERERKEAEFNRRIDSLRNVDKVRIRQDPNENSQIFQSKIKPLYRKPNADEQKLLAPNQEDLQTFAEFLRKKNIGLIKLIADKGCSKDLNIIVSTPHCLKYTMPGGGSSYSFRVESHWLPHLGDLNFGGENFQSSLGLLTNGIMVNIGDVSLEQIDPQNKALKTLVEFQPAKEIEKVGGFASLLEKGIGGDGFMYGSVLPVKENSTYLLRSIAYKSEFFRTIDKIEYDEFRFDKRKDIIVAFRVIRLVPNENVTIIWKELDEKNSPEIVFSKK
ncbi:hypothetical protein BH20ACI1_BH20ACI1_24300 [soil metagenome]